MQMLSMLPGEFQELGILKGDIKYVYLFEI